jgi:hypothetical protein
MATRNEWEEEYDPTVYRSMIDQESNLMNHRLTWLTTLQGLLFAALAFALDKVHLLIYLLAAVGIVSAASVVWSLTCAANAIHRLEIEWRQAANKCGYQGPGVIGRPRGPQLTEYLLPWFTLPCIFSLVWAAICILSGTGRLKTDSVAIPARAAIITSCKLIPPPILPSNSKKPAPYLPAEITCESKTK